MQILARNFRDDESGAVTVDWVVLTAAVVGLATVVYVQISESTVGLGDKVATAIDAESDS